MLPAPKSPPVPRKLTQLRFEPVIVAAAHRFETGRLANESRDLGQIAREWIIRPGALAPQLSDFGERSHQGVDRAIAIKRIAPPGPRKIAMFAEDLHRSSQQLLRRIKARSPPQDAPRTLRRVREDALQPALERLVSQRRRLLVVEHREDRIDSGLDGPLAEKIAAEGVDRTDAGKFQFFERAIQPRASFGRGIRARPLDLEAQPQLHLAGRFLCEGDRDGARHRATAASDQADDAADQRRRLAGPGSRFNEEGRAEFGRDPRSRVRVSEVGHGNARTALSRSRFPCGFRAERYSSYGPQTTR